MLKVRDWGGGKLVETEVPEWERWVPELRNQFERNQTRLVKSHKIGGRWENLYLDIDLVPSVREPIRFARDLGKELLQVASLVLFDALPEFSNPHPPFWFNFAQSGESTGLHDHSRLSALCGVVYLDCEKQSGNLFFRKDGEKDLQIAPSVGKMVLFEPWMRHGVKINLSERPRLSLAFNLFSFPLPMPPD